MNIRQHISTHLGRIYRVLLLGGTWQLGSFLAELCKAEPVAIRATKHQAMPCRLDDQTVYRSHRKA